LGNNSQKTLPVGLKLAGYDEIEYELSSLFLEIDVSPFIKSSASSSFPKKS
jgi:hypothetical protein